METYYWASLVWPKGRWHQVYTKPMYPRMYLHRNFTAAARFRLRHAGYYTYIYLYIYIYVCIYIYRIHICIYTYIHIHIYIYVNMYTNIYIYTYTHTYTLIYICVFLYIIYMYTYTRTRCTLRLWSVKSKNWFRATSGGRSTIDREGRDRHCEPVLGVLEKGIGVPGSKIGDFIEISRFLAALRHCL